MKYSQLLGAIAAAFVIMLCYLPWAFIPSHSITVTGLYAEGTNFGKPGLSNIILSGLSMLLFSISAIWAKRVNVFICALNVAWAVRNFLLVGACMMGECPEKKLALYLLVGVSVFIQIMSFLPKINIRS